MTYEIKDVEIFSTGTWNKDKYTLKDLENIVSSFGEVGFQPPLKLGHTEKQKLIQADGLPAAGWAQKLRI